MFDPNSIAQHWMAQRRLGFERLEAMRREELQRMTEAESAAIFAQLDPPRPYELRPTSGLVEQQRRFHRRPSLEERVEATLDDQE